MTQLSSEYQQTLSVVRFTATVCLKEC